MMCSMFLPFGVLYYLYGVINDLRVVAFLVTTRVVFYLFLHSFLPVDDSSDCIIRGKFLPDNNVIDFDSHLVGSVLAVSDNTHFRNSRHSTSLSSSTQKKNIRFCLDSYDN